MTARDDKRCACQHCAGRGYVTVREVGTHAKNYGELTRWKCNCDGTFSVGAFPSYALAPAQSIDDAEFGLREHREARDSALSTTSQKTGGIKLPVSIGQDPEGEPDAETMIVILDASGVALDPEQIVAALNAVPPSFEKWLSDQPHLEDHGPLPITDERMYVAATVRAAWTAGAGSMPSATPLFTLDTAERVCFYEQEFYVLSNFSAFRVNIDGVWFDTSEAAYHWHRFYPEQRRHRRAILAAVSAHEAFRYAQDHKADQRPDWDAIKCNVMKATLRAKADQHEYVRRKLLETGERELVENSWRDPYWGWGPNRDGLNMLGKLWMEIRADLRAADGGKQT